jgi:isopropylmalate/homocitrate/citramalate synthase
MAVLPKHVRLVEVGPRDGLQNEAGAVPTAARIELIDRLADAGLKVIESGSFVSPKWVPRMADTAEVMAGIDRRDDVSYPVLVPNMKGLEAAIAAGAGEIAVFAAATESFSRKNINCSVAESMDRFRPVCAAALKQDTASVRRSPPKRWSSGSPRLSRGPGWRSISTTLTGRRWPTFWPAWNAVSR